MQYKKYILPLVFILTIFFSILPFAIYFYEISHGLLSSSQEWYAQGNNHGPWRYSNEGLFIFYPQMFLAAGAFAASFFRYIETESKKIIALGALLIVLQFVAFFLQLYFLGWTFD